MTRGSAFAGYFSAGPRALLAVLLLFTVTAVSTSAKVESAEVLVAVAGDIACDPDALPVSGQCRDAATAELILSRNPAIVLALGDTQYVNGSLNDFLRAYDTTWGQFKDITYPTVGNHEYLSGNANGYHNYFGSRAGGVKGYYAFDVNGWRLYSLNAECDRINCNEERDWMRADVLAHPGTCQLMFMHRPLYSSGGHESNFGRRFWVVGYNNKFELALAGHDHRYERFAPMNPSGAIDAAGIRSFIVGTGGKSLFGKGNAATGSQFRYNLNYGVLFLTLRPGSYDWEFRTIADALIDAGSGTCR
jgi:acid phosphatase type 7